MWKLVCPLLCLDIRSISITFIRQECRLKWTRAGCWKCTARRHVAAWYANRDQPAIWNLGKTCFPLFGLPLSFSVIEEIYALAVQLISHGASCACSMHVTVQQLRAGTSSQRSQDSRASTTVPDRAYLIIWLTLLQPHSRLVGSPVHAVPRRRMQATMRV